MASKKELLQAQTFSRRRLLTAFVSGAPGGRELEPAKPLRGVIVGIVLAVLVVGGSLIAGAFTGEQDEDWKVNALVVVEETGARYVSVNGELYPVHNITSARLLAFADTFRVVNLGETELEGMARGAATVGIPGAPDALPGVDHLINDQWLSCAPNSQQEWTSLRAEREAPTHTGAALVRTGEQTFYLHGEHRYAIAEEDVNALSHVLEFHPGDTHDVGARWLNIFTEGTPLAPFSMRDFGSTPPGPAAQLEVELTVGSVVALRDAQGESGPPHVVNEEGALVELTPVALALYYLGSGLGPDDVVTLDYGERQALRIDQESDLVPADWPARIPEALGGATPCVQLDRIEESDDAVPGAVDDGPGAVDDAGAGASDDSAGENGTPGPATGAGEPATNLHVVAVEEEIRDGPVHVDAGHGALVRLDGGGAQGAWAIVDERGTMYHIPPGNTEVLELLGYDESLPAPVPSAWAGLFRPGPTLSVEAARAGLPADALLDMDEHPDEHAEEG